MEGHALRMLEADYRWTEDRCIQLIRKFRSKSILWDTKSPLFYKQNIKKKVWENIGRELNTTGADCKHKMSILLSSFRREKGKLRNSISAGTTPYQSSWFAFNDLAFLINRNTQENMSELNEDDGADVTNSTSENPDTMEEYFVTAEDDSNEYTKTEPPSDEDEQLERDLEIVGLESGSPAPVKQLTDSDHIHYTITESSGKNMNKGGNIQKKTMKQTNSLKFEEIFSFTNFVQAKMRKYSYQTLNAVQKEICDILFKADQSCYGTASDDDATFNTSKKRKLSENLPN